MKVIIFDLWHTLAYEKSSLLFKNFKRDIETFLGKNYFERMNLEDIKVNELLNDIRKLVGFSKYKHLKAKIKKLSNSSLYYKDAIDIINYLKGKYNLGLISNTTTLVELQNLDSLFKYFDVVILSYKVGFMKPNTEIFKIAFNRLKLKIPDLKKQEILFVGDSYISDYIGAKEFGFKSLLLDRKNIHPKIKEKIKSLRELKKYLKKN